MVAQRQEIFGMSTKSRHIPIREDWLSLREEAPVDPWRPIVDAHHHLWEKPGAVYLGADMIADAATGHRVVATVAVEAKVWFDAALGPDLESLGETRMLAAIAAESEARPGAACKVAAGIVGFVDLTLGKRAGPVLDAHVAAAGGRFRGVRNASAWHADPEARGSVLLPPPGLLYQRDFREGLEALGERGLVFDAWMYHTQLAELADLARDMPDLPIVLDHQGGPIGIGPYAGRRAEVFADWRRDMEALSRHANIRVKLGGFGMLMSGFDFHERPQPPGSDQLAEAWGPYVTTCIDLFGASRCMFESNFPVDKGTTSYCVLWNTFKKIVSSRSEEEKNALFLATADRVYGLGVSQTVPAG